MSPSAASASGDAAVAGPSDGFKQFVELQAKYAEATSAMKNLRQSVQQREHDRQRARLTKKEMESVDGDVRLFKPVGRSFVLEKKATLMEGLDATRSSARAASSRRRRAPDKMGRRAIVGVGGAAGVFE